MMSLILMLLLGAGPLASASDHDHQHQAAEEGGHGADEEGLALSAEATARFGIEVKELKGPGPWLLPSSAALKTISFAAETGATPALTIRPSPPAPAEFP
jgi:hypothetical protein